MLKIKPILQFEEGKIVAIQKIRTKKKALSKVEDLVQEAIDKQAGDNIVLTVIHANIEDEAKEFQAKLASKFKDATVLISHFGPVIGTHLGEHAIGVSITSFDVDVTGF